MYKYITILLLLKIKLFLMRYSNFHYCSNIVKNYSRKLKRIRIMEYNPILLQNNSSGRTNKVLSKYLKVYQKESYYRK